MLFSTCLNPTNPSTFIVWWLKHALLSFASLKPYSIRFFYCHFHAMIADKGGLVVGSEIAVFKVPRDSTLKDPLKEIL